MKTLTIATLFAAALTTSTCFAQFGGFQNQGFRNQGFQQHHNQGFRQQGFRGNRNQNGFRRHHSGGRISPELIQGIVQLFDDRPQQNNRNPVNIVGTWNENYNGVRIVHTIDASFYHGMTYPNGGRARGHQASYDGLNIRLLDGLYTVTETSPGVLQLGKSGQTRFWTRAGNGGPFGDQPNHGTGEVVPSVQHAGIPQSMQGVWYTPSPEGTQWVYVLRKNDYDMFDFDPQTGRPIMEDGEPVQLMQNNLTYNSNTLSLSPGTEFADGPFAVQLSTDGSQLILTSQDGGDIRVLTRRP